jgi:hypothetical protein
VKIVTRLHADVRFERVSRYSIKLEVHEHKQASFSWFSNELHHNRFAGKVPGKVPDEDDNGCIDPTASEAHATRRHKRADSVHGDASFELLSSTCSPSTLKTEYRWLPTHSSSYTDRCSWKQSQSHRTSHSDLPKLKVPCTTSPDESLTGSKQPLLSVGNNSVSPGKRKSWHHAGSISDTGGPFALDRVQHPNLEFDAKRRKTLMHECLDGNMDEDADSSSQDDCSDDAMYAHLNRINTGSMGEAQSLPSPDSFRFSKSESPQRRSASRRKADSSPGARIYTAALASNKQTVFSWQGKQRSVQSALSNASSSPVYLITPPASDNESSPVSMEPLSQEQIQQNYHEFEERKRKKAAEQAYYAATIPGFDGVVSPTDLVDKSFERIFIEDDEADDWTSEIDEMSEGMSCVGLEV